MIPASAQGINVTCEVLSPFHVALNSLSLVWVFYGKPEMIRQNASHAYENEKPGNINKHLPTNTETKKNAHTEIQ